MAHHNETTEHEKIVFKSLTVMRQFIKQQLRLDCTFWACEGTPQNNYIKKMVTCGRCQSIIETQRLVNKLKKTIE